MDAIVDLPHALTWKLLFTPVLPGRWTPKNVLVTVGISLLSCILTANYVSDYSLPVHGGIEADILRYLKYTSGYAVTATSILYF